MQRLVTFQGDLFNVRDDQGRWVMLLDRIDVKRFATAAEIREAMQRHEFAQYPLPSFDPDSGQYHWGDDDLYAEDEISDDLKMIGWPDECVPPLLELARLSVKLGVHD